MFPVFVLAALAVPVVAAGVGVGVAVRRFEGEYATTLAMRGWARSREFSFHPEAPRWIDSVWLPWLA